MSSYAKRAAFSAYHETCPYVDEAVYGLLNEISEKLNLTFAQEKEFWPLVDVCTSKIKDQTTGLRDALIEAYKQVEEVQEEMEEAVAELQSRIDTLESGVQ